MRKLIGHGELLLYLDYDGVLHHEDVWWHARIGPYMRAPDEYKLSNTYRSLSPCWRHTRR